MSSSAQDKNLPATAQQRQSLTRAVDGAGKIDPGDILDQFVRMIFFAHGLERSEQGATGKAADAETGDATTLIFVYERTLTPNIGVELVLGIPPKISAKATGSVAWQGKPILGKKPFEIAHLGLGHVPENRDIFPKLTVHQNLQLGQKSKGKDVRWSFNDMYAMFPRLKEREHTEAGVLSGGEQQMLTLCRTLMGDPDLIIIDEPTEGLAPKIVELVGEYLQKLKARGVSVLLIEQKLTIAMAISDRALVMGHGSIVFHGTPESLRADPYTRKEWLEV